VAIVIVLAAAAGVLLGGHISSKTTSSTSSGVTTSSSTSVAASPFMINYSQLIVGYKGGLFQLGLDAAGTKPLAGIVVVLNTPVQAAMCTGFGGVALSFNNCTPGPNKSYAFTVSPGGSFLANSTFSGVDTGAGPGSAVVGQSYSVSITATYTDGSTATQTLSVQGTSGD